VLKEILVALYKTLLIAGVLVVPIALWCFIFYLCIGEDGYIHEWGMLFVFFSFFGSGMGVIIHFIIHYVNNKSHNWCLLCLAGKGLEKL
jgi:hypothetical protein